MHLKYVTALCFIMGFTFATEPAKVHEDQPSEASRKYRQTPDENSTNVFSPSQFIYLKAAQQDPRSRRYCQQQQVDSENLLKIQGQLRKRNAALEEDQKYSESRPVSPRTWKVVHPKFVTEKVAVDKSDSMDAEKGKRKAKRENRETQTLQRRGLIDFGTNYFSNPSTLYLEASKNDGAQNTHEKDINALNSLLGRTPMAQLRGLQQLLNSHAVKVAQDHTPIQEHVDDIENPQTRPNIKVEPQPVASHNLVHEAQVILQGQPNLDDLQAQLNAVSQMQAQEAFAQAQQKALENVKFQHEALALAKAQAEKIALAQVQSQNLVLAHVQAETQALAQAEARAQSLAQAEAALIHQNALQKAEEAQALIQQNALQKVEEQQEEEERARELKSREETEEVLGQSSHQQNLALKILHQAAEEVRNKNVAIHARRQAQAYKELAAQQYSRKNVYLSEQTNLYPTQEAAAYIQPQALALTQQEPPFEEEAYVEPSSELQENYVKPEVEQDDGEYNEYASKYSFGYRVRDYHSGTDYGHEETKEGKVIKGRYDVLLPDGRVQVVDYWADPSGYHARVTYSNVAHH